MARTLDIRDAIVNDLVASGLFATGQVYTEPTTIDKTSPPCALIIPGGGGSTDPELSTQRTGDTAQDFIIQLVVKSSTPHDDVMNLLDGIRDQIEVTSSNVHGVTNVQYADVSDWEEVLTAGDIGNLIGVIQATVTVRYLYQKGSL